MSDLTSSDTGKTGSSKKGPAPVVVVHPIFGRASRARNVIGLVVLIAVAVVGWFQYSAVLGYNAAVKALEARAKDEEKGLLSNQEAATLFGKSPDGPDSDFQDGFVTYTKKTYTWRGLLKSYTLTAFYTKGAQPGLHHYETEGEKYTPPAPVSSTPRTTATAPGQSRGEAPTKAADTAPAKTTDTAPTKAADTAPAKTAGPAPAKTTDPAPANAPK